MPKQKREPRPLAELQTLPDDALVVDTEAALLALCSVSTLRMKRLTGGGPQFLRPAGTTMIRYRVGDVKRWSTSRVLQSTSEAA